MIARMQKSMKTRDQGFTLIELLVVMIIIGILAAIAIPVFLSQRAKAQDTATKSDAATVGKELATYFVDNTAASATLVKQASGKYTVGTSDAGAVSNNVTLASQTYGAGAAAATAWCVGFTNSEGSKKNWVYTAAGGLQEGTCAANGVRQAPTTP